MEPKETRGQTVQWPKQAMALLQSSTPCRASARLRNYGQQGLTIKIGGKAANQKRIWWGGMLPARRASSCWHDAVKLLRMHIQARFGRGLTGMTFKRQSRMDFCCTGQAGFLQATCKNDPCPLARILLNVSAVVILKHRQKRNLVGRKPFFGGLLLALFVFVLAMANSGALHHLVHADAGQSNHECAVKLLSNGLIDFSPVTVAVASSPSFAFFCVLPEVQFLLAVDYSLLPSRGPPASLT